MREILIGFDSAWANKALGGICALTLQNGQVTEFSQPQLVRFAEALDFINTAKASADYVLIALDQPTLVPNATGIRPAERVAGSIVNSLGGGVQPANTSKTSMFGLAAPIWSFLTAVGARENPSVARSAQSGFFLMEVFPALALPSFVPTIWQRKRAAKYNPAARNFSYSDWQMVAQGLSARAQQHGLSALAQTLQELHGLAKPKKGDQDKLDAIISLMIGHHWRFGDPAQSAVIGCETQGYIVTPAAPEIQARLSASAILRGVPFNRSFLHDANQSRAPK